MAKPVVLLSPRFRAALKSMGTGDLKRIEEALCVIADSFGRPHIHSGLSIRRLHSNIFECRAGLKVRLLFRQKGNSLEFFFVGDHDQVRRILRGG